MNDFQVGRGWKPVTSSGREILVIGLGLALLLGLLASALHGAKLPEGPSLTVATPSQGEMAAATAPGWLPPVLQTLFHFAVAAGAIGLLTREGWREAFLRVAVGLGLVTFVLAVLLHLTPPGNVAVLPGGPPTELPSPSAPPREAAPDALLQPPGWAAFLAVLSLAAVLAWWIRRPSGQQREAVSPHDEARSPPTSGDAPAIPCPESAVPGTVPLCWAQMVRMLSARSGVVMARSLTPRELCEALAGTGFRHEAIRQLTRLFEEVRYGARADEPRREEALAALAILEEEYGAP